MLNPSALTLNAATATGAQLRVSASSSALARNTQAPAPVTATRTPAGPLLTKTPTMEKREAGWLNFCQPAFSGTGKLTAQAMYDSGIGTLFDVGDVDDDGRLDLTFCGKLSGKSVGFRRGLAGGNFGPMITYPVDPTYGASQCGFVDLDRDGNLDIWIARGTGNGSVFQVLYGNGAAQFTLDPMTIGISGDHWVWAGNLGEDDYVDILGLREQPNNGFLQVRHGTPTWLEDMLYNFEVEGWTQITGFLGNFDGNEIPDVLTRSGSHDVLEIFRGDGTGLFFDGVTVVGDVAISDVAVGDLNEDGLDDMLTVRAYEDGSSLSKVQVVLSNP